jgi:hypothetical protein
METTYHGSTETQQPRIGLCLTTSPRSAAGYAAEKNGGDVVTVITIDLAGLTVTEAEYDYDGCEPIVPTDDTDIITYTDSDMYGHDHETYMLLTDRAVAAAAVIETITADEAFDA